MTSDVFITTNSVEAAELSQILDRVHDRDIDLGAVTFDEQQGQLILPVDILDYDAAVFRKKFAFLDIEDVPIKRAKLVFHGVASYTLLDESQIGTCMINTIADEGDFVLISGCTDCDFRIYGSDISLELSVSDKVLGTKSIFRGFS